MGIFREYDIRGIVEEDLGPDVVEKIGRAYATLARDRGHKKLRLVVMDAFLLRCFIKPCLRD